MDDKDLKINSLEIMMEQNNKDHSEIKKTIDIGFEKINNKIDTIANNKANRWVEDAMKWIFISAGVVFIGLLVRWLVLLEIK